MAGCLRSAVSLALRSNLIETIGGGCPDFLRSYMKSPSCNFSKSQGTEAFKQNKGPGSGSKEERIASLYPNNYTSRNFYNLLKL
jgi:hypothetical protein